MDCSVPGSSVQGISQARILEWVAFPSGDIPNLGIEPLSPAQEGRFFTTEPLWKPHVQFFFTSMEMHLLLFNY